jgi:hypothetical protein
MNYLITLVYKQHLPNMMLHQINSIRITVCESRTIINLNHVWNPNTLQYFTSLGMDMIIYDLHLYVCKHESGDKILLNIMAGLYK